MKPPGSIAVTRPLATTAARGRPGRRNAGAALFWGRRRREPASLPAAHSPAPLTLAFAFPLRLDPGRAERSPATLTLRERLRETVVREGARIEREIRHEHGGRLETIVRELIERTRTAHSSAPSPTAQRLPTASPPRPPGTDRARASAGAVRLPRLGRVWPAPAVSRPEKREALSALTAATALSMRGLPVPPPARARPARAAEWPRTPLRRASAPNEAPAAASRRRGRERPETAALPRPVAAVQDRLRVERVFSTRSIRDERLVRRERVELVWGPGAAGDHTAQPAAPLAAAAPAPAVQVLTAASLPAARPASAPAQPVAAALPEMNRIVDEVVRRIERVARDERMRRGA